MPEGNAGARVNGRRLINILRVIGAPLLLLIVLLRVDLRETTAAFSHIRPVPFAGAAFLVTVNFAMQIIKWRYLLTPSAKVTRGELIRSVIGGYVFVLAIPGRIGEFSRALFIRRESKLKVMGLVAIDKLSGFSIIILMSGLSLSLLYPKLYYAPVIGVFGLFILAASKPRFLITRAQKLARLLPLKGKVDLFLEGIQTLGSRRIVVLLAISLLYFLVYSTQFYLLLLAFEQVKLRVMAICFPLLMLVNSLPITVGGLGVREGAAVLFFSRFGVQESSALGAALLLFTINILIPGLCGLAFVHKIGSQQTSSKEKNT
jgi:hypothetical protein